jgi:hypothetical protein
MVTTRGTRLSRLRDLCARRLLHALGLVAVLPLAAVDPAMVVLLFDAEFLALMGSVGLAMLRGDARVALRRFGQSLFVTEVRAAVALTRERPRSLLEC